MSKIESLGLFNSGEFRLHSGAASSFKIDCDALSDYDIATLAAEIADRVQFGSVEGVPKGGLRLASVLKRYAFTGWRPLLIVDDVLTTGASMEAQRAGRPAIGVVLFARGPCPTWITPVFQMWGGHEATKQDTDGGRAHACASCLEQFHSGEDEIQFFMHVACHQALFNQPRSCCAETARAMREAAAEEAELSAEANEAARKHVDCLPDAEPSRSIFRGGRDSSRLLAIAIRALPIPGEPRDDMMQVARKK